MSPPVKVTVSEYVEHLVPDECLATTRHVSNGGAHHPISNALRLEACVASCRISARAVPERTPAAFVVTRAESVMGDVPAAATPSGVRSVPGSLNATFSLPWQGTLRKTTRPGRSLSVILSPSHLPLCQESQLPIRASSAKSRTWFTGRILSKSHRPPRPNHFSRAAT
jgi:hypothetical protein